RVVSLAAGADGVLWLGTFDEGLMRYDRRRGACRAYTQEQGLAHTDVGGIFLDEAGRLWLTTSNGLSRFDPVREAFTRFTEEDGLPSNTFRYPARHRNAAGELLLGGTRGFTIFRPDAVPADTTPPRVAITRLLVDGQPYPLVREGDGFRPIRLRYGQNDLAFEYAALDLRAPGRTRYRVRLEGADTTWRYVGAQAADRYPRLAPGHYAFGVEGTNADGYWSTAPTALAFIIRPPLWQTWYFWGLVAVLVGAVVAAGYQYRIRQIRRVAETRQRIADDLHDDIGSKISTVALRLALAARNPALPEEERADLDGLARASRDVVGGVRDAVWFADGSNDDLAALVARMEQTAQEMLSGRPYSFDRPDVLAPSLLTMAVRHELFLLFKEAVHNAVKYGEPPVGVRVGLDERRFQFSITDAGPGFDPGAVKRGRGLSTMARRAAALGGELRVDSTPGGRTSVSFVLPSRKHPGRWAAVRSLLRRPPGR
ncbi:MAG TPA: ATP-binding protein, partial [Rhodothermales bacterium]|nr:ATP-binding protein [Rhodothermales bacterium]